MTDRCPISFVVVNWHEDQATRVCLASIRASVGDRAAEIVVVDNGRRTRDGRRSRFGPGVVVVNNGRNRGFAGGANDGWRRSTGSVIALINNDCHLGRDWLVAGLATLDDPTVGVVGGPEYAWDDFHVLGDTSSPRRTVVTVDTRLGFSVLGNAEPPGPIAVGSLNGSNLLARRDVLESLGGFDEQFFAYYEDADLCARVLALGWRLVYNPAMAVWHRNGLTSRRHPLRTAYLARRNHLLFVARHFPDRSYPRTIARNCQEYLASAISGSVGGLRGRLAGVGLLTGAERLACVGATCWPAVAWPRMRRSRRQLVHSGQHDESYLSKLAVLQSTDAVGIVR
ncbi:MAG: glycosyltransferase family 2 protein [Acidimicrobiales bacterium]